jgi:hypothetical protein
MPKKKQKRRAPSFVQKHLKLLSAAVLAVMISIVSFAVVSGTDTKASDVNFAAVAGSVGRGDEIDAAEIQGETSVDDSYDQQQIANTQTDSAALSDITQAIPDEN